MNRNFQQPSPRGRAIGELLQLTALSAFSVGQPLLGLLSDFPGFFVARQAAPIDIVLLASVLFAALPLALFALVRCAGFVSPKLGAIAQSACVGTLGALFTLPWLGRMLPNFAALAIAASVAIGTLFAFGVSRSVAVRRFAEFCSVGAAVFLVQFFSNPEIETLVSQSHESSAVEAPHVRERMPVVVVIFDELPLSSLLGADRRIDRDRFPAFARLADRATLFRNATGVANYTQQAVPAILTGRYPGVNPKLAIASEHPFNLFSMLARDYQLNIFESQMQLADPSQIPRAAFVKRMRSLFDDLSIVYLHLVLPDSLAERLPRINETWKDFGSARSATDVIESASDASEHESDASEYKSDASEYKSDAGAYESAAKAHSAFDSHPTYFRRFIASIEDHPSPALHFIHSTMPHRPWRYLPSGNVYFPYDPRSNGPYRSLSEEWWQQEAYQRHLLQLQFVDRLLGELLDRLEALDLYQRSLVVVTADHGVSFWPDDNARIVGSSGHPEDILSVPLLIKRPNQSRGRVDDRNVEAVDILPTIADLVGAQLGSSGSKLGSSGSEEAGFSFDGCSVFAASCEERPEKVAYSSKRARTQTLQELHFDKAIGLEDRTLRRNLAWFELGLYRFGPYAKLVGTRVDALEVGNAPAGRAVFEDEARPSYLDPAEKHVPVRISAWLEFEPAREPTPQIAIAVGGKILTVVPAPTYRVGGHRLLATIPEDALIAGVEPALLLVEGSPEQPRLLPIDTH
jgi:hypothetical protein